MNRGLQQRWVIFTFVPNIFHKLRKKCFYWILRGFMGASWHVKDYELLEFLNKQSNLRKQRMYSVPRSYLVIMLFLFQHFIIFSYADRKKSINNASYACCVQGKNYQLTEQEALVYVHSIAICYYVCYISCYVHSGFFCLKHLTSFQLGG